MQQTHDFFLVIDLEATCDNQGTIAKSAMEIIEIGAVMVDTKTYQTVDEFQTFVRPRVCPTLTPFCRELTTISQEEVDAAPLFPQALADLTRFIADSDVLFCSWGDYDRLQFELDAQRWQVALPFTNHLNLKKRFSAVYGESKGLGMAQALKRCKIPLTGSHHRGIDDARNIAKLIPFLFH